MKSSPSEGQQRHGAVEAIIQAARTGDIHTVRKKLKPSIFKKTLDVNIQDERECTPLHYAAKVSNLEMVELLLSRGADLRAVDRHGWSVLHYAVRYGSADIVEFLIRQGCDIHSKEKRGWNLLHLAARNGQAEKARLLLENGINVHALQNQGWNALHLAVRYGQPDTISTLLEYGINIDVDNQGWTALQLAVLNGHTDIVSILLNKEANINITNREGKTSLDIAREEGFDRIAAMIIEKEFMEGSPSLPSPPPTPPSAPALETMEDVPFIDETLPGAANTFDRWRIRLKKDLEMVSNDDLSQDLPDDYNDEVTFGWKTFDEEKQELLQQLEKVKMKEIIRLQEEMKKVEGRLNVYLDKVGKQRRFFLSEIENLQNSISNSEEDSRSRYQNLKEDITQLSVLIDNASSEADLLQTLLNHQISHPFGVSSSRRKTELIHQLIQVQKEESEELTEAKTMKYQQLESFQENLQLEAEKTRRKIRILEEELETLEAEKERKVRSLRESLVKLGGELEKAQRSSSSQQEDDECNLACPVCLELLKPPLRIFQCPEGHILCENCKENPSMVHCPQCRVHLESNCSRNRALEEIARNYFL